SNWQPIPLKALTRHKNLDSGLNPHYVRVRAYTLGRCSTLQVRARSFVRAHCRNDDLTPGNVKLCESAGRAGGLPCYLGIQELILECLN
ncbi:MAG: hypothetical protein WAN54_07415, partial [Syntrophobacteraceae bacterium]